MLGPPPAASKVAAATGETGGALGVTGGTTDTVAVTNGGCSVGSG